MSQLIKKAAVVALLAGSTEATRIQQKSFLTLSESAPSTVNEASEAAKQNFLAAEALQTKNVFHAYRSHDAASMDKDEAAQMHAEATAEEMMHEEMSQSVKKDVRKLSMADVKYMSYNEPAKPQYPQKATLASPKLSEQAASSTSNNQAAPSKDATKSKEVKTQAAQGKTDKKENPQSGTPISDAILDTLKKVQGSQKDDGKQSTVQLQAEAHVAAKATTGSTLNACYGEEPECLPPPVFNSEDKTFDEAVAYQKDAEAKVDKEAGNLDEQTLTNEQKQEKAEEKKAEEKKAEAEHVQQEVQKQAAAGVPSGPLTTSAAVEHVLKDKDVDAENDKAIKDSLCKIPTDEERQERAARATGGKV